MPLYEFECANCSKQCELFVPLREKNERQRCPFCGKKMLVKKPSVVNFKIKGYNSSNGYSKKEN